MGDDFLRSARSYLWPGLIVILGLLQIFAASAVDVPCGLTEAQRADPCFSTASIELVVDPENCAQYYHCINGKGFLMPCPSGFHFNDEEKSCDLPSNAGCLCTDDVEDEETDPEGENEEDCPPASCGSVSHGGLSPDEKDCRFYYQCVNGKNVRMPCPSGLYFNAVLKWCDWPEESGCDFNGNVTSKPPVVTEEPGVTEDPENTDWPPTEPPAKCGDIEHGDLSPDTTNCGYYYQCVFGENVRMPCPPGLHFNPKLKWCDWPNQAGCESSPGGGSTSSPVSSTTESNCGGSGGTGCPATEVPMKCGNLNHGDLSKDPESCEHFYQCVWGKNVQIPCPKGLHFNAVLKVCDWPLQAGCDSSIVTNAPGGGCSGSKGGSCP